MKKMIKLLNLLESTPANLGIAFVLSLGVMFLLNALLGSMGGIPAFIAFFVSFYLARGCAHQDIFFADIHKSTYTQKTKWLLCNYSIGYLVLWTITRGVLTVSKLKGWGYIAGVSFGSYFSEVYGTTMLERWAYFFVGILMFIFVISLFPLVTIRNVRSFVRYLIVDVLGYAVICLLITQICNLFISNDLENRANCVLDDLLMCKLDYNWQATLFIIVILLLAVAVFVMVFVLARYFYEETEKLSKRLMILEVSLIAVCGVAFVVLAHNMLQKMETLPKYAKVATYLTKDEAFGPISYYQTVYIPVNEKRDFCGEDYAIGYLAEESTNCDSRLYMLTTQNLLYCSPLWANQYLQYYGTLNRMYESVAIVEKKKAWLQDEMFVMWDEEWATESGYSGAKSGYMICDRSFVEALRDTFPEVSYCKADFTDYDAYFTIYGYQDANESFQEEVPIGDWCGCILVKDNRFFFGNMQNEITGDLKQQLLDVLGGNETPTEENEEMH